MQLTLQGGSMNPHVKFVTSLSVYTSPSLHLHVILHHCDPYDGCIAPDRPYYQVRSCHSCTPLTAETRFRRWNFSTSHSDNRTLVVITTDVVHHSDTVDTANRLYHHCDPVRRSIRHLTTAGATPLSVHRSPSRALDSRSSRSVTTRYNPSRHHC
jgi:hypothetical protein